MSHLKERVYSPDNLRIQKEFPTANPVVDYYNSNEASQLISRSEPRANEPFTQSIYESYNAANEANRIRELSHLSQEEKRYYISENMISYLEEFVGEIKVKKLSGVLKDDGSIEMMGTNISDMYNLSADIAGAGSREYLEKEGLDKISSHLLAGNNRAVWISPPKLADYGFAFTFVVDDYNEALRGKPFREVLLRYDEPIHSIDTSKSVYSSLVDRVGVTAPDSSNFKTDSDFLAHPLVYNHDGFEDIEALYEYLDISPEDVRRSEEFRENVLPIIDVYVDQYTDIIFEMSELKADSENLRSIQLEQDANDIIGAMFNMARIVNRRLRKESPAHQNDEHVLEQLQGVSNQQEMLAMARYMAQHEELVIEGGSNCSVTKQTGLLESSFVNAISGGVGISIGMQAAGIDLNTTVKKEFTGKCVNCPNCEKTVDAIVTKKLIQCPECKHTVKRT